MECKLEEQAFRYSEGLLDEQQASEFEQHLTTCSCCRETVRESCEMDSLLHESLADEPVDEQILGTLTSRIMADLPLPAPEVKPRRKSLGLLGVAWLRPQMVAAALVLALVAGTLIFSSPSAVVARLREVLYFVPGVGITATTDSSLANAKPVSVEVGGYTFTVNVLVSSPEGTTVKFEVSGLPPGKEAWQEAERAVPAAKNDSVGDSVVERWGYAAGSVRNRPKPYLLDALGKRYEVHGYHHGVGGNPKQQVISGFMGFVQLPAGTEQVELVVPFESLLPPALVQEGNEWRLSIPLVSIDSVHFADARELNLTQTVDGVSVQLAAASFTPESTGMSIYLSTLDEGSTPVYVGQQITPEELSPQLADAEGRTYQRIPLDGMRPVSNPLQVQLSFEAVPSDVSQLRLLVPVISLQQQGQAEAHVSLEGHQVGDSWKLDQEVYLGGNRLRLVGAELGENKAGEKQLKIDLDMGPRQGERRFISFRIKPDEISGWESHFDHETGQTDYIVVPVAEGESGVTLTLTEPTVAVYGNWAFEFDPHAEQPTATVD